MFEELIIIASGALFVFILFFFRNQFYRCAEYTLATLNAILSEQAEEDKIKDLQKQNHQLLLTLLGVIFIFLLALLPVVVCSQMFDETPSFYFLLWFSVGAIIPAIILSARKRQGYSELSILLHKLILNNYNVGRWLFFKSIKKNSSNPQSKFLIVTGLARCGTTSLTEKLFESGKFKSFDYSNMPFLFSPRLWRKIYNPKSKEKKERAHHDGIKIGLDSVEAFDEYFFKCFLDDGYIKDKYIAEHKLPVEVYENYLHFQNLLYGETKIYLTKNNNFILRLKSFVELNKEAKVVVLFREPLQHTISLLQQHISFLETQKQEPFVIQYMDWLGHNEFGLNQKHFQFDNVEFDDYDKDSLNYWLSSWINYYRYLLSLPENNNILLVSYKDYLADPKKVVDFVAIQLDISLDDTLSYTKFDKKERPVIEYKYSDDLYNRAKEIYESLLKKVSIQQ